VRQLLLHRYRDRFPLSILDIKFLYHHLLITNMDERQNFMIKTLARSLSTTEIAQTIAYWKQDWQILEYRPTENLFKRQHTADKDPSSDGYGGSKKPKIMPGSDTDTVRGKAIQSDDCEIISASSKKSGETEHS